MTKKPKTKLPKFVMSRRLLSICNWDINRMVNVFISSYFQCFCWLFKIATSNCNVSEIFFLNFDFYFDNLSLINSRQLPKTSQRVWYLSSLWPHWVLPIAVPMTTSLKSDKFVKRIKKSGCMLMLPMQEVLSFAQNIGKVIHPKYVL